MKIVHIVRHGESYSNTSDFWMSDDVGLTEKGINQANAVASRFENLPIEIIFSSNIQRAKDTASIIKRKIDKPIEYHDLFNERKWPSEQNGLHKKGEESNKMSEEIWKIFPNPELRYSDEENFTDLKERIKNILLFLESRQEENIMIVTHGFILRIMMAYIVMGEDLSPEECDQFIDKFHTKNTGITTIHHGKTNKKTNWHLSSWNDHSHL